MSDEKRREKSKSRAQLPDVWRDREALTWLEDSRRLAWRSVDATVRLLEEFGFSAAALPVSNLECYPPIDDPEAAAPTAAELAVYGTLLPIAERYLKFDRVAFSSRIERESAVVQELTQLSTDMLNILHSKSDIVAWITQSNPYKRLPIFKERLGDLSLEDILIELQACCEEMKRGKLRRGRPKRVDLTSVAADGAALWNVLSGKRVKKNFQTHWIVVDDFHERDLKFMLRFMRIFDKSVTVRNVATVIKSMPKKILSSGL